MHEAYISSPERLEALSHNVKSASPSKYSLWGKTNHNERNVSQPHEPRDFLHTCRLSPLEWAGAFSSNLASSWVAMTLTLLLFPTAADSTFLSHRAGMDGLSSRPVLDNSSWGEKGKEVCFFSPAVDSPVGLIGPFWSVWLLKLGHYSHLQTDSSSSSSPNRPRPSPFCPVNDTRSYFDSRQSREIVKWRFLRF